MRPSSNEFLKTGSNETLDHSREEKEAKKRRRELVKNLQKLKEK